MTSEELKNRRILEQAAAIAAAAGVQVDMDALLNRERDIIQQKKQDREFRNAVETLLQREHYKHGTVVRKCKNCGGEFITTYCYHQFCSDLCSIEEFKKHYGIDPRKLNVPRNEWPTEPVGSVPAKMTKWLYLWAKDLIEKFEALSQDQFENLDTDDPEPAEVGVPAGISDGLDLTASLQFDLDYTAPSIQEPVVLTEHFDLPASPPLLPDKPAVLDDIVFDY